MPTTGEQAMVLRRFAGINLSVDPAFLQPDQLQLAQNWVPDQRTYLLTKRRGALLPATGTLIGSTTRVPCIIRVYDRAGNRYLYAVEDRAAGTDRLQVSTNDGAFAAIASTFASTDLRLYGATILGNRVYFGNGTDSLKYVDLSTPTTGNDLGPILQTANDAGAAAVTFAPNTAANIYGGLISYRWVIYDTATKTFTNVASTVRTTTVTAGNNAIFTSPPAGLAGAEKWHLFAAVPNFPIELAFDQTPEGLAVATAFTLSTIRSNTAPIPLANVTRTGTFLTSYRGRLMVAGDLTASGANKSRLYGSSVLLPGLEQDIYNRGDFFPANALINIARDDGDVITGMAAVVGSIQSTDPRAPLAIFKNRSTWLLYGDILDDDNATLLNLSSYIGCIAHATIQPTPIGLIFCGHDSVYLLPPGGQGPQDIGQDIWPEIRNIPREQRPNAIATYHKGFYKLAYCPPGGSTNTKQLWLDCKRFTGTPSWWGPHSVVAYSAFTVAQRDTAEDDRGFGAVEGSGNILLHDQDVYTDNGSTISARLRTASIDGGQPFQRKTFTRTRLNGRAGAPTQLTVQVTVDSGTQATTDPLVLTGAQGAVWDVSEWDTAEWASSVFEEALSTFPAARPRGRSIDIEITNEDTQRVDLRDFELVYVPVDRPVGPATVVTRY